MDAGGSGRWLCAAAAIASRSARSATVLIGAHRRSQIELPAAAAVRWRDDEEYALRCDGTGVMERCGRGRVDGTTPTTNK